MKSLHTIYTTALTATLLLTAGCSDLLEEKLISDQTTDTYYATEQGFNDLVTSAYSPLRDIHKQRDLTLLGTDVFTLVGDPAITTYQSLNEYSSQGLNAQSGAVAAYWNTLYSAIGRTNTVMDRAATADMDDALKAVRVGEAKFLRAMYYFYLVQQFGDVPLMLNEVTTVITTAERRPQSEVYAQIIKDLEEAMKVLPPQQDDYGRVTLGAAGHLLAKVYLTRGYLDFGQSTDFQQAADLAEDVIGSGEYRLLDTYAEVFEQGNEVNDEIIFAVQYSDNLATNGDGSDAHSIFGQGVDLMTGMDRSSTYNRQQPHYVPTRFLSTLYNPDLDARYDVTFLREFYATVSQGDVTKGDLVLYFPRWDQPWTEEEMAAVDYYVVNLDEYYMSPEKNFQFAPIWKFFEAGLPYGDDLGTRDQFVFRLAETHLIAAEAYLKTGKEAEALPHINAVRRRAATTGNADAMELTAVTINDILDERARELAGEEMRWNELKRTGKLIERVLLHNERAAATAQINENHLLRPIPLSQIERTTTEFPQNPGYTK